MLFYGIKFCMKLNQKVIASNHTIYYFGLLCLMWHCHTPLFNTENNKYAHLLRTIVLITFKAVRMYASELDKATRSNRLCG